MVPLISHLLASVGLTVLIVWPTRGPSAWLRERVLRPLLPTAARAVLDCYICCSFWAAFSLSPLWRCLGATEWVWFGCFMLPGLFWLILRPDRHDPPNALREIVVTTVTVPIERLLSVPRPAQFIDELRSCALAKTSTHIIFDLDSPCYRAIREKYKHDGPATEEFEQSAQGARPCAAERRCHDKQPRTSSPKR